MCTHGHTGTDKQPHRIVTGVFRLCHLDLAPALRREGEDGRTYLV